jgi:hypothetical protein
MIWLAIKWRAYASRIGVEIVDQQLDPATQARLLYQLNTYTTTSRAVPVSRLDVIFHPEMFNDYNN